MFILLEILVVLAICVPLIFMVRKSKIDSAPEDKKDARQRLIYKSIIGAVIVAVIVWNIYLSTYVNWQWFASKGYLDVYAKVLAAKWLMFGIAFPVAFGFFFANLKIVFKGARRRASDTEVAVVTSLILALMMGSSLAGQWAVRLLSKNQVVSDVVDPIFDRSISYYLFSLPWKMTLLSWVTTTVVLTFLAVLVAFLSSLIRLGVLNKKKQKTRVEWGVYQRTLAQLFILGAIWALLIAFKQRFNVDRLVFSTSGVVVGAGYTDLHAGLFGIRATRVVWIIAAAVLVLSSMGPFRQRIYRKDSGKVSPFRVVALPAGTVVLLVLVNVVIPGVQQATRVSPDELKAETPYIEHNMNFTRTAYSIGPDQIEEREINVGREITPDVVKANRQTLDSIRLWDYRALKDYLREHQEIKPYYEFHDVDIDRYDIDGVQREVMLAIRELETDQLDDRARTWMNRTFKYTHGYGLVMTPVSEFGSGGKPNLLIRNIPSEASAPELVVDQPRIYYGELTDTPVLTTPTIEEFDYPAGEENAYTNYDGSGGISLDSNWKKLCFAWRLNSHQILFSPDVNQDTRVHMNRDIATMVRKIAPWLKYDYDPYAVISDGRVKWVQDAYTTSTNYPYSTTCTSEEVQYAGINYIANATKIVIDAYDGSVDFFLFDEEDPIVRTYQTIFPSLFKSRSEIPPDIRAHLRYPEDLFTIQLEMYGTYQMRNTQVFYTKEDVWERPREKYHQEDDAVVEPYYVTASLPGESQPQFILMSPYTPREKNVLRAWMCASSDGDGNGKLIVYKFPKGEEIKGPRMVESRIDQDSEISQVLTLWDQKGSQVLRGNLLVVPLFFEDKAYLLYVEPVYLQADGAKMPELKKIVLADQERIVWGDSFGESMTALVGTAIVGRPESAVGLAGAITVGDDADVPRALLPLKTALDRYQTLQGQGRFAEAGAELERAYALLERLLTTQ